MEENEETQIKVSNRKPGRTLLVSNEYKDEINLDGLDNIHETFKRFSSIKEPLEAKIFAVNESINSHQLSKLKNTNIIKKVSYLNQVNLI